MKASYLNSKGGTDSLAAGELPRPEPKAGEVLVRVRATAITPTEVLWSPTFQTKSGAPRPFPIVLSHEFSGVVESLGETVAGLKVGDEVYGLNDWFANGAQAEYCVAAANTLAQKPHSIDHAHSAAVPISALTAWQGLFERAQIGRGQRILIHGAAGGVGIFAVQMASRSGAQVFATASAVNLDFVRSLGAEHVIDYRKDRFELFARDMDVVFDGVGGETLERSWAVLKPGGKMVTVATQDGESPDQRSRDAFLLVRSDGDQLARIAAMIDAGELRVVIEKTFPLDQAREAYAQAQRGKMRGKIVLTIAS